MLALLGPSGCGKTTTLRLIAGFERPDAGSVVLDGEEVAGRQPLRARGTRRVGVVFQDYALFPHLTVARNVGYGVERDRRTERVAEMLELVGLADAGDRLPHELSGGQQQRVALARALAPDPALVLLDEPFSNLDAALRADVRAEVRAILAAAEATTVFVTHDQEEALSLADRIAVMRDGRILQVDTPLDVYARPDDRFVATFVGDADVLPGQADDGRVVTAIGALALDAPVRRGAVDVVVRPERVRLRLDGAGDGVVAEITYFGHDQLIAVRLADGTACGRAWGRCGSSSRATGCRSRCRATSSRTRTAPSPPSEPRASLRARRRAGRSRRGAPARAPRPRRPVLERASAPGGLAASFEVAGVRVDHGSHRLHRSCPPEILDELRAELGDDLQLRRRNGRIRLGGRWVAFPPSIGDLARRLPLRLTARLAATPRRARCAGLGATRSRRSSAPASAPRCSTSSTRPTWRRSGGSPPPR